MSRIVSLAITASVMVMSASSRADKTDWHAQMATPDPAFTQIPLWFWNDDLDDDEIKRQMADFRAHGVYGFMIHPRMGLPKSISFMNERWLGHVRTAIEEAARTGMVVCFYDEFMYPSGSAHGEVVRSNPDFAAQALAMTHQDAAGPTTHTIPRLAEGRHITTVIARLADDGKTLDRTTFRTIPKDQRELDLPSGQWRIMTFTQVPSGGHIRGVHEGEDDRQPNAPPAGDLLNPEAMQTFIRLAYDPYDTVASEHYGKTVIGMFTDEPSMLGRGHRKGIKPWTKGFGRFFADRRGYDLLPLLPALFLDVGGGTQEIRRDFDRALLERLEETYYKPLSQWCVDRGIALTGHPALSDEIRFLRHFHIPGQDIVWRCALPNDKSALEGPNSTVGKCTSSAARHDGRRRNSNEVYGAYGWQLTMDEMKWLADWLMVRGVSLLYPHAFYYSMRDYRAMERPPDVGPNNAWWPHYKHFADYTSRLCKLLTDCQQVCDVAILGREDGLPWHAARYLFEHQIDFNYLEPWRLLDQAKIVQGQLLVGQARYSTVIVDRDESLEEPLPERLKAFEQAGGRVRFCKNEPDERLIAGLHRDVRIAPVSPDLRYIHVKKHGVDFYLLTNEGEKTIETDVTVRCVGLAEWFDAWTGAFRPARILRIDSDTTTLALHLGRRESIVLCIGPAITPAIAPKRQESEAVETVQPAGSWTVISPSSGRVGDELGDWLSVSATRYFVGTLIYNTAFDLRCSDPSEYLLDLGEVGEFAVVRLNGRDLGVRLWAPFEWDITNALRDGRNELVVEVTNSLANRYTPKKPRSSGLMGPVSIRERRSAARHH